MNRLVRASILATTALMAAPVAMAASGPALMPMPRAITAAEGTLAVDGEFAVRFSGCGNAAFLDRAAARLRSDVQRQTGRKTDPAKPVAVAVSCRGETLLADAGEGYRLTVGNDGVTIDADGPAGAVRAFATLRQLVGLAPGGIALAATRIDDAPRFAWRGVMLDVVRHFVTLETIKRQIDAMEKVKLNVLHLHLSDDQGFRVESRRYPKLTANGPFYTQAEIRDLIAYAAERGVRVVPEFDVPGHSRAIVDAYPEIGIKGKPTGFGMDVALNPGKPETYRFIEGLFGEMAALFPDRYFHIGGDEVAKGIWDNDPAVAALKAREKLADTAAVEHYFHHRVQAIVRKLGKTMIGWEEVAHSGLPTDTVVHAWQTSNATADAVAKGYPTIVSAGYYLDLLMPAEFSYTKDPADSDSAGLAPDFAEALRKKSPLLANIVTDALIAFPRPPLTAGQESKILGGEGALWAETATDELVDDRLWPRAAALAERFWSPREVRDVPDMYRRLALVQGQLSATGLQDRAIRARMAMRLSPGNPAPVETLLDVVGPVRNMAHNKQIKAVLAGKRIVQSFNELADAAPVDSLAAHRFTADARAYGAGDKAGLAALRAQLAIWRDNDARFAAAAKGRPLLEEALPTSKQVAELAAAGLAAIDAIEARRAPAPAALESWRRQLATLDTQEAASLRPLESFLSPQPPADLIVKLGPGIRTLVEAAAQQRR